MKIKSNNQPIGIFDSGLGGLTVLKEVCRILPREDIIYFGDTARVPYGGKSKPTIDRFTKQIADFLTQLNVKLIIIACNTASSLSYRTLSEYVNVPVVGVIEPGVLKAIKTSKTGRIGVIATTSTVTSKAYEKTIKRINPKIKVLSKSCPLFVPLAEEGWSRAKVTRTIAGLYLNKFQKKIDTLILGCTHYPLLKTAIKKSFQHKVNLIDSAREAALIAANELSRQGLRSTKKGTAKQSFYVSDDPKKFKLNGEKILRKKIMNIRKVDFDV